MYLLLILSCYMCHVHVPCYSCTHACMPGTYLAPTKSQSFVSRADSHAIITTYVDEAVEVPHLVPMKRGDVLVHGSGTNLSAQWRHAYVLNFKHPEVIAEERCMGFTHLHNDEVNWDKFLTV